MLASYLDGALELARYEVMEEEKLYWGEVPPCPGVWARGETLPACQRQLREALSDWVALRLRKGLDLPVIAGIDLNQIELTSNA